MYNEGVYVDLNGQDSEAIMLSSGFDVYTTEKGVAPASGKPTILKGKDGTHSGETIIKSKKMANSIANQIRFTSDPFGPDATWIEIPAQSRATFYVTGLIPGRLYWFQTRTYSTKGQSDWSDPFQFMVR